MIHIANYPDGFKFKVSIRVLETVTEKAEEPMYEPSRKELWALFALWLVSMGFATAVGWVAWHMLLFIKVWWGSL